MYNNKGHKLLFRSTRRSAEWKGREGRGVECGVEWVGHALAALSCAVLLHAINTQVHRLADTDLQPCILDKNKHSSSGQSTGKHKRRVQQLHRCHVPRQNASGLFLFWFFLDVLLFFSSQVAVFMSP